MTRHPMSLTLIAVVAALAGTAHAQTAGPTVPPTVGAPRRPMDLSAIRTTYVIPYARADQGTPGISRTSIDRSLASNRVIGSVGYLCGVDSFAPGADENGGPASSYGRGSTYLGAKLSYRFH